MKNLIITPDFSNDQFSEEINCLIRVNHKNIVWFLGYCADTQGELVKTKGRYVIADKQRRLLCFEYVPNGNLHRYLKGISL